VSVASVVEVEPAAKLYFRSEADSFEPVLAQTQERREDARSTYACDGTVYVFRRGGSCSIARSGPLKLG